MGVISAATSEPDDDAASPEPEVDAASSEPEVDAATLDDELVLASHEVMEAMHAVLLTGHDERPSTCIELQIFTLSRSERKVVVH